MGITSSDAAVPTAPTKRRWNWWKLGFFITLLAFELTREVTVIEMAAEAEPSVSAQVWGGEGFAFARGRWMRTDGGDRLVPATVNIECRQETGQCIEASTMINDRYVFAPEVDHFAAAFTADAVTYENDVPECAKYTVRIDLRLRQALAVRERKAHPTNPNCASMEPRIEMRLSDGFDRDRDPLSGHLVPLIQLVSAMVRVLDSTSEAE